MAITFQKRQKEMKRQEKAREKLERRAQRKLDKRAENDTTTGDPDVDHIQLGPQAPLEDIDPQGGAS